MGKKSDIRIDFINLVESPDESISYPMGILYLSAYLKKHNFSNIGFTEYICLLRKLEENETKENKFRIFPQQYFESFREENFKNLINYLVERRPHIILLGPVTTYHLVELMYLSKKLRETFKEQMLIAGGPHFGKENRLDKELLELCPEIDGLTVGEAEETIIEVVNKFYSRYIKNGTIPHRTECLGDLAQIPGVRTRINDLQIRDPPSLDNMLLPDIQLLEEYWNGPHITTQYSYSLSQRRNPVIYTDRGYFQGDSDWGVIEDDIRRFSSWKSRISRFPFGVIIGSRGCPYSCSFCASSGERRIHTARYIFELISDINKRYGTDTFVFFESLFTTISQHEQERVLELCDLLRKSNLDIEYIIEIRADVVSGLPDIVIASMIQSGCVNFNLGLEKGSDRALQIIRKGTKIRHHFTAVNKLRRIAKDLDREIFINGSFILGGPGETKKDVNETLSHSWHLHLDAVTFYIMNIFPGTQIYSEALNEGKIKPGLSPFLDITHFPQYPSEEIPLAYLNRKIELNDNTRMAFNEFKKSVKELEYQFTPEEKRVPSNVLLNETGELFKSFCDFIDASLDLVRDLGDPALWDNDSKAVLQCHIVKINNHIRRVEEKLFQKNPEYDPEYGDYHLSTISSSFRYFNKIFMEFLEDNFQ